MHLFKRSYPEKSDFIPEHEAKLNLHMDTLELKKLKRWLCKKSKSHAHRLRIEKHGRPPLSDNADKRFYG